jgi:peptidoglycan/xylan/chitin deacetylase (PgdA/CDA1 family)
MATNGFRLVTVMYHYVRDTESTAFPNIKGVSVKDFRRQVRTVKEGFITPPLEGIIEFLEGQWSPDGDICIMTFDDGLIEHHDTVAQILSESGVPGAFFLPTAALEDHEVLSVHMNHFLLAALGTIELRRHLTDAARSLEIALPPAPDADRVRAVYRWDDEETAALKYLVNHQLDPPTSERLLAHVFPDVLGPPEDFARSLYIDWKQALAMQSAGFDMGGHSHDHKVLANMDPAKQRSDLTRSMNLLNANLGPGKRGFAYPYGKPATYTQQTIECLDDLGYSCAFNTTVDDGRVGTPKWEIPRIDPKDL